jgi:hypothetical protein
MAIRSTFGASGAVETSIGRTLLMESPLILRVSSVSRHGIQRAPSQRNSMVPLNKLLQLLSTHVVVLAEM